MNWKWTLKLKDLFEKYDDDDLSVEAVAEEACKRLEALPQEAQRALEENGYMSFEELTDMVQNCIYLDDFNSALDELREAADVDKTLWVETQ